MGFNSGFKGLNSWHTVLVLFVSFGATAPDWARASSFTTFLDLTRHTTSGRTPLDEWSARRRDLYLTTHNNHYGQTSIPPSGFEPTISAGERPQTYALDRMATGTGRALLILQHQNRPSCAPCCNDSLTHLLYWTFLTVYVKEFGSF